MSNNTTLARPYAKAAFEYALAHGNIKSWDELLQAAAWVVQQPKAQRFLKDPKITTEQRYQWLINICNPAMPADENNFFKLLALYKRFLLLPEIAALFTHYRVEHEKTMNVQVMSAYPLSEHEKERLASALKIRLHREIKLDCQINKNILGGVIVRAGDLVIDSSVRGSLTRLETALTN